ncbi:flavanone 3-dioxygenase 3-like [Arachis stenosperma]|uniref:flavanone 3-dioxygenase 3-like n=1 Tax=Arachis stenosperma TaxID=217475 RepID=UPI0025ACC200|nr:flavanone 3-dioxygenase 3-like [Arachis stenosperma]
MDNQAKSSSGASSFTSAMNLDQQGVSFIPQCYVLPPSQRPNIIHHHDEHVLPLPIIDLSDFHDQSRRYQIINKIRNACKEFGFFQRYILYFHFPYRNLRYTVFGCFLINESFIAYYKISNVINHGIDESAINEALKAAEEFFNLPHDEKMCLFSDDVHKPVRYGTSLNHARDEVFCWRDFIKHYSHPLPDWIHLWPSNPPSYRKNMGNYAEAVQDLQNKLMEMIFESLGLNPSYLEEEVNGGSQLLAVNCYPACPEPELTLGIHPHSDYGSITVLLQTRSGLEFKNKNNNWEAVPLVEGGLVVQLGDQMEVLSNGVYKSVIHRATVNVDKKRFSIVSLHSFAMDKKIGPAKELVDDNHHQLPKCYNEFSFREFLHFISNNDITKERFLDTLKIMK